MLQTIKIKNRVMTPKEKAEQLVDIYEDRCPEYIKHYTAKWCALIAVNELIDEQTAWQNGQVNPVLYWQEVKQEIEKL